MKRKDLVFEYPESLVAQEPVYPPRVMVADSRGPREETWNQFLSQFQSGDVLVVNNTRVIHRRVFGKTSHQENFEILFVEPLEERKWVVLCPSSRLQPNESVRLPADVDFQVIEKGRTQIARVSEELTESYFLEHGEVPLPPYIQKARHERHTRPADRSWYQTVFAEAAGSSAAPTAGLHFKQPDLDDLKNRGVKIVSLTLHVGLGTYLPVTSEDLSRHHMHFEDVRIPAATWSEIESAMAEKRRVIALGTTVTRALESVKTQKLLPDGKGGYTGRTDLLILPGFDFQVVDVLLTNFHQPESTLLALVCAFSGFEKVLSAYRWAIEHRFRLFSYGDLSVWIPQ